MIKLMWLIVIVAIAVLMPSLVLLAQEAVTTATPAAPEVAPTHVDIPWGSWVAGVANTLQPVVTLALTGIASYLAAAYLPPWLRAFAGDAAQRRVNSVLQKAVSSAVAQTKDAVSGKVATIPVASEILARGMQYAVDQAPALIKDASKDNIDNLSKMILARMEEAGVVPEGFDVKEAAATIAPAVKKKDEGKFDFAGAIKSGLGG